MVTTRGLGLQCEYNMMFFVCTENFTIFVCKCCALLTKITAAYAAVHKRCHPDSNLRIKVLQTFALPLGYGTVKKWSGRRDSDPRHPPWQGGTLPTELLPHKCALGRNRTTDTVIFSHMLYQLSYQGRYGDPEGARTLDLRRDRPAF